MTRLDWSAYVADFRGVLRWNTYLDGFGVSRPGVEIPLYIKEMSLPIRKIKLSEQSTVERRVGFESLRTNMLFYGSPDLLTTTISGWLITPLNHYVDGLGASRTEWQPVDVNGNPLNLGNLSYADVISAFIEGRMYPSFSTGQPQRKDPDYFITPQGKKYLNPVIVSWEPTYTTVQKKTPFTMTLDLEK